MSRMPIWIGVLAGPILWLISMEAQFALAPWICAWNWRFVPFAVAAAAAAHCGLRVDKLASMAAGERRRDAHKGVSSRAMAMAGVFLSAGFLTVLLAQSIPQLIMSGCE